MITAIPPAYCQEIDAKELYTRARGASDESEWIDQFAGSAWRTLVATPRSTIEISDEPFLSGDLDDYMSPGLKRLGTTRVTITYHGTMKPMPFDEESV